MDNLLRVVFLCLLILVQSYPPAFTQGTFDSNNAAPNIGLTNSGTTATEGIASPIPAANDVTPNWQAAGMSSSGIPTGRATCATLTPTGVLPPNASDDVHLIQAAIATCGLGQALHLNGDFIFDQSQILFLNRGISLVGDGTCTRGGSNIAPECHTSITHYNGAVARYNGSVCAGTTTFVGGIAGTTLTVTSVIYGTIATNQTIYPGTSGTKITSGSGLSWVVNNSQTVAPGTTFYVDNACTTNNTLVYMSPTSTFDYGWGVSGKACGHSNPCEVGLQLVADANKGDTVIQLASTTGLSANQYVLLDEHSQAIYQTDPISSLGFTWAAYDFQTASTTPVTGRAFWAKHTTAFPTDDFSGNGFPFNTQGGIGCGYGMNCDRVTSEIKKIVSVDTVNHTITVDTPLTIAMRVLGGVGVQFQGYISTGCGSTTPGQVLCVTSVTAGGNNLGVNQPLWWGSQTAGAATWYMAPTNSGTGTGGTGTYTVSNAQNGGSSGNVNVGSAGSPVTFCANCGNAQVLLPQSQSGVATTMLSGAGIENISIGRAVQGAIGVNQCAGCWIKGTDLWGWINGGIDIQNSIRLEVRGNYIHDGYDLQNNGVEYAISLNAAACEILIIDNIITFAGKSMVARAGCGGNVIAYNYMPITMYEAGVIGNQWHDHAANCSHYTGPHHCLFEGNWANNMGDDDTHGNTVYVTYYRNYAPGYRPDFNDPSFTTRTSLTYNPSDAPVSDISNIGFATGQAYPFTGGNGPVRCYGTQPWNYFAAVVGNVCGVSGVSTAGNGWVRFGNFTSGNKHIFLLGWNSISPYVPDPNLTPGVAPWIFIDANYDFLSGAQTFASSSHAIPNSLVWTSPPYSTAGASCTYPWPPFDPAGATKIKNASGPGGCSSIAGLMAKARYDNGFPLGQAP